MELNVAKLSVATSTCMLRSDLRTRLTRTPEPQRNSEYGTLNRLIHLNGLTSLTSTSYINEKSDTFSIQKFALMCDDCIYRLIVQSRCRQTHQRSSQCYDAHVVCIKCALSFFCLCVCALSLKLIFLFQTQKCVKLNSGSDGKCFLVFFALKNKYKHSRVEHHSP